MNYNMLAPPQSLTDWRIFIDEEVGWEEEVQEARRLVGACDEDRRTKSNEVIKPSKLTKWISCWISKSIISILAITSATG